jgi:hypothetical protein
MDVYQQWLDPYFVLSLRARWPTRSLDPGWSLFWSARDARMACLPLGLTSPHVQIQKDKSSAERDDLDGLHLPARLVQTR